MLKVLLIDDSFEKIAKYKEVLGEYEELNIRDIDSAACVADAEEKMLDTQYDLVILDLYLPLRLGDEPSPENAITLLNDLSDGEDLLMPSNIVGITRWKEADSKYKEIFDQNLLAYILYEENNDDWKKKVRNKIDFLLRAQRSVQYRKEYNYDVAIINALESENKHVKRLFGNAWKELKIPNDSSTTYYATIIKNAVNKEIRIVTCYAPNMASTASSLLTTKVIYNFSPRYLIMTGIAAGVNRSDVQLGDIMVAEYVLDGAGGKIQEDKDGIGIFMPDMRQIQMDSDMLNLIRTLAANSKILNNIEEAYPFEHSKPNTKLRLHVGPMASVPAVLASEVEVDKIKNHCRKLMGVEMEGYGFFYASHHGVHPRPQYTILIKSVSDYADSKKSDDYQDYSMYTSAAFAHYLVTQSLHF